jgi:nucleotide-binding universal stress UspA family protein
MFTRILVGLDGSEISRRAFERAMDFAGQNGAELHAISVVSHGKDTSEAQALLDSLKSLAGERNLSLTTHLASGNPGEVIIATAEKTGADLIVVGSLGKTQMERIRLGSVSAYITKNARTNIIVIRD